MRNTVTSQHSGDGFTRRNFTRLLALSGSLMFAGEVGARSESLIKTPAQPDERFWLSLRKQFLMPEDVGVMNASELCPSPVSVIQAMYRSTREMETDLSFGFRKKMEASREETRRAIASFLRVSPEEIVITRNTSEGNNIVSSGLDLKAGDEVILLPGSHNSIEDAFIQKSKRFGYTVSTIAEPDPRPEPDYYVDAVRRAIGPQTRVLAFSHVNSLNGDLAPAKELCRIARERGVLTLLDGACAMGVADVDLSDIQPDFYAASGHKWPCSPKEVGVLYMNSRVQDRVQPSIISGHPGGTKLAETMEALGQRDEPAIVGFREALAFQTGIGRKLIKERTRDLRQSLVEGLRSIDGVRVVTKADPAQSSSVVLFQPGTLDPSKLVTAMYQNDRIGGKSYGQDGLRFSPHIFNTMTEVDRAIAAVSKYMRQGV